MDPLMLNVLTGCTFSSTQVTKDFRLTTATCDGKQYQIHDSKLTNQFSMLGPDGACNVIRRDLLEKGSVVGNCPANTVKLVLAAATFSKGDGP